VELKFLSATKTLDMKTILTAQGQVVVPPGARRKLALRPGTKFACRVINGSIVLTRKRNPAAGRVWSPIPPPG